METQNNNNENHITIFVATGNKISKIKKINNSNNSENHSAASAVPIENNRPVKLQDENESVDYHVSKATGKHQPKQLEWTYARTA